MGLVLGVLGGLLGVILGLVVLVLVVPLRVEGRAELREDLLNASAGASWGFGFARLDVVQREGLVLRILNRPVYRHSGKRSETSAPKEKREGKKSGRRMAPGALWRAARRLLASLQIRAHIDGQIGARDPYDTAQIFGLLTTGRALLPNLDTSELAIEWREPVLHLDGRVQARVWPVAIVWIALTEYGRSSWRRDSG